MESNVNPTFVRNRRLLVSVILMISIAAFFWSLSRVPALNEKAQMGLRTSISSIAFDVITPIAAADGLLMRVVKTTANWLYTNWKGMTFGLLFSAMALTVLGTVRKRSFERPWLNTLSGMLFGAPLGVCVNCATPIAQGLYAAGARLETALATLMSSPTLNVIVLSMSFTLLPWFMAMASVVGVLVVLSFLPFLVAKTLGGIADTTSQSGPTRLKPPVPSLLLERESWGEAAVTVIRDFSRNLLFVAKVALPLMLLAGTLGAIVIEVVPLQRLVDVTVTPFSLLLVAVVAVLLPVPMAFNVVIVMVLLSAGLPPGLGAVLLFGLAVFSVYPASIIARQISKSLSLALSAIVVVVAVLVGGATHLYFGHQERLQKAQLIEVTEQRSQDMLQRVVAVCNKSPETSERCYVSQFRKLIAILPGADICGVRTHSMSLGSCRRNLKYIRAIDSAKQRESLQPCFNLSSAEGQDSCLQTAALELAIDQRSDDFCGRLGEMESVKQCHIEYLNASLLFNPDASACDKLANADRGLCLTNAKIYQIADTENIALCGQLSEPGAQAQCRWITATSLVGKRNDTTGCDVLGSEPRKRCLEQASGWEAERNRDSGLCGEIESLDLRQTCLLRVSNAEIAYELSSSALATPPPNRAAEIIDEQSNLVVLQSETKAIAREVIGENDEVKLQRSVYQPGEHSGTFVRREVSELGVRNRWRFRGTDLFEPFIIGKGIASGDFNSDQWPDVLLATESGVALFENVGGYFRPVELDQGMLQDKNVFVVAMVDTDGDGNQDIFASTYGGKNYLLLNQSRDFSEVSVTELPGADRLLTISVGFGDLEQDNDLDMVFGNWSSGAEKLFSPEYSANEILLKSPDGFHLVPMNDIRGETNSVLITDINHDQLTDVIFGNDRLVPDFFYLSAPNGQLEGLSKDSLVPLSSMYTMSLEVADFNNDLRQDIFSTDMSFSRQPTTHYCSHIKNKDEMERCDAWLVVLSQLKNINVSVCEDAPDVSSCVDAMTIQAAKTLRDRNLCSRVTSSASAKRLCEHLAETAAPESSIDTSVHIEQRQQNTLLLNDGVKYVEKAREFGIQSSYWSWHAGAADLDKDEYNDVYVGNGFHFGDGFYEVQPNRMFRNNQGLGFEDVAQAWGLDDRINTPSYTYLDYDLDGDLDIFATGVIDGPRIFENRLNNNQSISFRLKQAEGNTDAIGAQVTIRYGGDKAQLKEISMSGGFMSFDHPVAYFGLGQTSGVDQVAIRWPDGAVTEIETPLSAGYHYTVTRQF